MEKTKNKKILILCGQTGASLALSAKENLEYRDMEFPINDKEQNNKKGKKGKYKKDWEH